MTDREHTLSPLNKTWLFDIDGTVLKHNGYVTDGFDSLLSGAKEFISSIPRDDVVVLLTSRSEELKIVTERFLKGSGIRFDTIIYGLPFGERILINDRKDSGLITAIAINTDRDTFMKDMFIVDKNI